MLQGHTFHAFARNDLRNDGPYVYSQFVGGLPPAIFLFLTGVTFAFGMERSDRRGLSWGGHLLTSFKRARYLLVLALLFRVQLWLFSGASTSWTDILKVDVLNCMGVTMLLLAPLSLLDKEHRARWATIAGLAIAFASPLVSMLDWKSVPWIVRDYLTPSAAYFSVFPWSAFLAFGVAAGTILKSVTADQMNRVMTWSTLIGIVLVFGTQYFSNLPYNIYPAADFWLNSPLLILIKLGIVLIIGGIAFLWTEHVVQEKWSWLKQLGTTSLLVYWVHIELVYGRWFGSWKENLNNYQCFAFAVCLTLLMVGLSVMRTTSRKWVELQWAAIRSGSRK